MPGRNSQQRLSEHGGENLTACHVTRSTIWGRPEAMLDYVLLLLEPKPLKCQKRMDVSGFLGYERYRKAQTQGSAKNPRDRNRYCTFFKIKKRGGVGYSKPKKVSRREKQSNRLKRYGVLQPEIPTARTDRKGVRARRTNPRFVHDIPYRQVVPRERNRDALGLARLQLHVREATKDGRRLARSDREMHVHLWYLYVYSPVPRVKSPSHTKSTGKV
jgi:hypothetical protein